MEESIRNHPNYDLFTLSSSAFPHTAFRTGAHRNSSEIGGVKVTVMSTFQRCDFSPLSVSSQVFWQTGGKDAIKNCFPNALLLDHHHSYLLIKDGWERNVLCQLRRILFPSYTNCFMSEHKFIQN